ncbi:keratin, type I cytoskeletal 10-like [Camellia sinensis]|uniref:keratin, type I cytoskeletal 10-like n=1 Tax=Camellia sinensis TaxID=4442 RepID=UPI00103622EF|nr:keratin, type I cytoskeletal 10-like [Camellia sinensis]
MTSDSTDDINVGVALSTALLLPGDLERNVQYSEYENYALMLQHPVQVKRLLLDKGEGGGSSGGCGDGDICGDGIGYYGANGGASGRLVEVVIVVVVVVVVVGGYISGGGSSSSGNGGNNGVGGDDSGDSCSTSGGGDGEHGINRDNDR